MYFGWTPISTIWGLNMLRLCAQEQVRGSGEGGGNGDTGGCWAGFHRHHNLVCTQTRFLGAEFANRLINHATPNLGKQMPFPPFIVQSKTEFAVPGPEHSALGVNTRSVERGVRGARQGSGQGRVDQEPGPCSTKPEPSIPLHMKGKQAADTGTHGLPSGAQCGMRGHSPLHVCALGLVSSRGV